MVKTSTNDSISLAPSHADILKLCCLETFIPTKVACCKRSKQQFAMDAAVEKLSKEIDIIGTIKSRRFVNLALEHLLEGL